MWLNKLDFQEDLYSLTAIELRIAEEFIAFNKYLLSLEFDTSIEDYKDIVNALNAKRLSDKHGFIYVYFLAVKAIIIMKENWAKSIDELDKLYTISDKTLDIIEESNTKINEHQEEVHQQQEQDLNKAQLLSQKIKNNEI